MLSLAACGSTEAPPEPATQAATPTAAVPEPSGALTLGDWANYPAAPAEVESAELTDRRWAQVTAELACVDRAHQGDPDAQTDGAARVLAHHRTTAEAVMDFGIAVNADVARAHTLGDLVASAAETCS